MREQPRFVDVDLELEPGRLREALEKIREEGSCWTASHDRDTRAVVQRKPTLIGLD